MPRKKPISHLVLITSDLPLGIPSDPDDVSFTLGGAYVDEASAVADAESWANGRTNMEVVLVELKSRKFGRLLSKAERAARK